MAFAAALDRLNASALRAANAVATIGGQDVPALLDQPQDVSLEYGGAGMAVTRIRLGLRTQDAGALVAQDTLAVDGDDHRVTHRDDDGAGWTVLHLERVTA